MSSSTFENPVIEISRAEGWASELPTLFILEGGDKVGKSTFYQALRRATDYFPFVIDRFVGSNWVYDKYYRRNTPEGTDTMYYETMRELQNHFNVVEVLLTCDPEVQIQRINEAEVGEDKIKALANQHETDDLFRQWLAASPSLYKYHIKTDKGTVETCVASLLSQVFAAGYRGPIKVRIPEEVHQ